ncbi:MAG: GNAT family N-acetyltransferase [Fibrobacterota bacterium]
MFRKVESTHDIEAVAALAQKIWTAHFTPLIGEKQVAYMLTRFQSVSAIAHQIDTEGYNYYLVLNNSAPIGYFAYFQQNNLIYLSKIYLRKSARGRGIGTEIIRFLEENARRNRRSTIRLNVYKGNHEVIAIYKKMGFTIIDSPRIDIGEGYILDDYRMEKHIKNVQQPLRTD